MALSVASSVPEHYRRAFSDTFDHVIQQDKAKLSNKLTIKPFAGKEKVFTDLEELSFSARGRLQNSTPTEISAHKRKMSKGNFKCQVIFDQADEDFLAELGLPDSETIEAMRMAWHRKLDESAAIAATATVYGGVEPYTTPIDLPSSQMVAVNWVKPGETPANSGLTPHKLIKAAQIFEENEIDLMEREVCLALNPKGKADLMAYVEASPNEVWARMITAWLEGKDSKLFGFTPVMTNRLVTDVSTDVDTIFAYEKGRGIWMSDEPLDIKMDILPSRDHALQISAYGQYAFMRRYEKTVVTIACDRTP